MMRNSNYIRKLNVYRKDIDRSRFAVPETMTNIIIHTYHDENAHYGVKKIFQEINKTYWFPSMR